ncbi:ABC transporter permease [Solibacillus sp. FSL H8-0523]|uniref:ABC transporter permease n=1 Tax=Solibacillus sp. FSL H8-0523 TaxID=2954511 RepID=UPI0031014A49
MQFVKNEWIKMWSQKNAWIMLIITIALLSLVMGLNKYFDDPSATTGERLESNEEHLKNLKEWSSYGEQTPDDTAYYNDEIAKTEYRIANDLPSEQTMSRSENNNFTLTMSIMMVSIFTTVIAAGIVSNEFGTGTIKMLLTRPVARWKILLSKLVASILYGLVLLVIACAFSALLSFILFNNDNAITLSVVNGQVIEQALESTYFEMIGYSLASMVMTTIFAFMIGSLFGSSTLAVSLSLFILLMGQTATMFLSQYEFAKYIWFANDISYYAPGSSPMIEGLTIGFSVVVNIVYAVIFLAITFGYFMKRDVTA